MAILPEFLVRDELKKKTIVDVFPKENFEFNLKIIKRTHGIFSLNANKFMEFFEELISIESKA